MRPWLKDVIFYVAQVPGDGGLDWGYTKNPSEAIHLPIYWQRRFARDGGRIVEMGDKQ
jgi:hypothetical protein